ncbi:SEC-C domain-containing protein [Nocardia sp. SYP-A9097]|uniref:SEC-C domain-containing protein n=1 Tax=Nocardia sp. SYP-A9097 TaxID=2663237 RepID=UPI0018918E8A|nr:SEC-C domain-containing protein [Nocardia sp. SYP-A9097]
MSDPMSSSERRQLQALEREHARLLAEQERLQGQLASRAAYLGSHLQPPGEIARQFEEAADADPVDRAQNLNEAAGYWAMAGELERARRMHLAAIADGGEVAGDARVWYAEFLLEFGDAQAGRALLDTVLAEGPDDFGIYESVAETFEAIDAPDEALHWFDAGLARLRLTAPDQEFELYRLAIGRSRIRESLGLPEDSDDRWAEQQREGWVERLTLDGRSAQTHSVATAVFYFPEPEFDAALRRWPQLREQYDSHEEHRESVEKRLRAMDSGHDTRVSPATVDGLAEYAAAGDGDPAQSKTRAAYAAELSRLGMDIDWPPGRNEPCWCGSSRKYKKCCGRPN